MGKAFGRCRRIERAEVHFLLDFSDLLRLVSHAHASTQLSNAF